VAVSIRDYTMTSNRTRHTARLVPGRQYAWEVSWLPGRRLNRDEAITAMVLADTTASGDVRPGHPAWPHLQGWAAELGMTRSQALQHVAAPPQRAWRQEKTAGPPGLVPPGPDPVMSGWIEDPDPVDLGWTDDPDWPAPDYPDPSWPGWGASRYCRPAHLSDPDVSNWHAERHLEQPGHPRDALHAGPDPWLDPEPARQADWEAGE
jgi:hypothetical protein